MTKVLTKTNNDNTFNFLNNATLLLNTLYIIDTEQTEIDCSLINFIHIWNKYVHKNSFELLQYFLNDHTLKIILMLYFSTRANKKKIRIYFSCKIHSKYAIYPLIHEDHLLLLIDEKQLKAIFLNYLQINNTVAFMKTPEKLETDPNLKFYLSSECEETKHINFNPNLLLFLDEDNSKSKFDNKIFVSLLNMAKKNHQTFSFIIMVCSYFEKQLNYLTGAESIYNIEIVDKKHTAIATL